MKDIGEAYYILGVKINRNRSDRMVTLSQEHYIKKILQRFNILDCNPINTSFAKGEYLSKEMGPKTLEEKRKMCNVLYSCDAPFPGGPLTTRQPAEYLWIPGNLTPLTKIGQSLLCTRALPKIQPIPTFYNDHTELLCE